MIDLVAAASPSFPWGTFALMALIWAGGYFIACAVWPWTAHKHCKGTGKRRSPSGKNWGNCRGCGGSGKKVRLGRRIWTYASNTHTNSK